MPTDIIEMFWGCTTCDAENKGRYKTCQNCGKPRTEDSPEWMPGDISPMAAVKDPQLLRKFKAGADWKCIYCGSSQFRVDGNCAQCGSSQREQDKKKACRGELTKSDIERLFPAPQAVADPFPEPEPEPDRFPALTWIGAEPTGEKTFEEPRGYREPVRQVSSPPTPAPTTTDIDEEDLPKIPKFKWPSPKVFGLLGGLAVLGVALFFLFRTREYDVTVQSLQWTRTVHVLRYQVWSREGWDPDSNAFDIHNEGRRIHHYDHVRIGSHTEHYSERVPCGQDCRTVKGSCYTTSRTCTSNKNGSATCTGGDRVCSPDTQSCTTKYCTEPRTREVDDYEDQPRYRNWYSWKVWAWGFNRDVVASGTTTETHWPSDDQLHLGQGVADGERERAAGREETYEVTFAANADTWKYHPATDSEFQKYPLQSSHRIKVSVATGVDVIR